MSYRILRHMEAALRFYGSGPLANRLRSLSTLIAIVWMVAIMCGIRWLLRLLAT